MATSSNTAPQTAAQVTFQTWRENWTSLSARERLLVRSAALCCGLALLWWVGIAPARQTLAQAQQNQAQTEAQRQAMLNARAQALALQGRPAIDRQASLSALQASVKNQLAAKAELQIQNDHATLILPSTAPEVLLGWLEQARLNAHALPIETKLQRNAAGQWEGRLLMSLPIL